MPYNFILVPQNSATTITCAFDGVTEPYFEVDIGNTKLTDLEFVDRRQEGKYSVIIAFMKFQDHH